MKNQKIVKFSGWECVVQKAKYATTNQNALELIDKKDGSPIATASVCIPGEIQLDDHVFIKSWSENEGMRECLEKHGIIEPAGGIINVSQYCHATVHKLIPQINE